MSKPACSELEPIHNYPGDSLLFLHFRLPPKTAAHAKTRSLTHSLSRAHSLTHSITHSLIVWWWCGVVVWQRRSFPQRKPRTQFHNSVSPVTESTSKGEFILTELARTRNCLYLLVSPYILLVVVHLLHLFQRDLLVISFSRLESPVIS
jgi:hypothetical protein